MILKSFDNYVFKAKFCMILKKYAEQGVLFFLCQCFVGTGQIQ